MDLPLYKYLIVFLIKGTQSNSETCVQAGKEKNLAVNINLASLKPAPLKNSNYRRGKKSNYNTDVFKEEQKGVKNCIFCVSPVGQEQWTGAGY